MSAQAQVIADVHEQVNSNTSNEQTALDEFGRDQSERTVELAPRAAEAVDQEVTAGKHSTYDDALAYIIQRGLAEIKRQRDAAKATADARLALVKKNNYASLVKSNPSLIANSEFVATMLRDLGVTPPASTK